MTDLQKVEFEMLKQVVRICDELHLRYFLVCGSALGAVKYNGFIPWDDDIDIGLFRKDYEIFIEKAPSMLPSNLFLQNYKTDAQWPSLIMRIRNSNTTNIVTLYKERNINHGVFIDIMPLDTYPSDRSAWFERRKTHYMRMRAAYLYQPEINPLTGMRSYVVKCFLQLFARDKIQKIMTKYDSFASDPSYCSEIICNHGNWQGKLEYAPREQYGEGTWATFEGLNVRIPDKYDEYLTKKYGDWRADLPPEQQVGHHYAEVIDLNRPYTEYIEIRRNGKVRVKKV